MEPTRKPAAGRPWAAPMAGRLEQLTIDSEVLRGNPLGDPHERPLWVYLPPGYDDAPDRRTRDLRDPGLHRPARHVAQPLGLPAATSPSCRRAVRGRGDAPPCIVVCVDCWTSLGGSQFLDSPGTGRYHTYLCDEVVPWVDEPLPHARRARAPRHRRQVERRLRRDGHADAAARPVRRPGHPRRRRPVRDAATSPSSATRARAPARPLRAARSTRSGRTSAAGPRSPKDGDGVLLNDVVHGRLLLGRRRRHRAAARSTRPPASWSPRCGSAGWRWDPVRMVPGHADALRVMRAIYIDAGTRDECFLDLGRRGVPPGARRRSA